MIGSLVLGAFEIMDRVVEERVLAINTAAVSIVETGDAHRLLPRMLGGLGPNHVYLASHLN